MFSLDEDGEIETKRFFKDSDELPKFIDKILDKSDDHTSFFLTGNFHSNFRKFKRVNGSEHGRGGNEYFNISEYKGENCYISNENACF